MNDFKFTIIIPIYYNGYYLEESIKSLINQDIGFENNIQLIFIDVTHNNKTIDLINQYQKIYPNNVMLLSTNNESLHYIKNLGLKNTSGEFISFLNCNDTFSKDSLSLVKNFFEKYEDIDLISIPIIFSDTNEEHLLNYKFNDEPLIDLNKASDCPQFNLQSAFIRKNSFVGFDETVCAGEDLIFINKILLDKLKYGVVKNTKYYCCNSSDLLNYEYNSKDSFKDRVKVYKHLIDLSLKEYEDVLEFIQFSILLDLKQILLFNGFDNVFKDSKQIDKLRNSISQVLKYINQEIILNHEFLSKDLKSFLIFLKNNDFHVIKENKKILFKSNDYLIGNLNSKFQIDVIDLRKNVLNISGFFKSNCSKKFLSIEAIVIDKKGLKKTFYPDYVDYFDRKNEKYLGIDWIFKYSFDFKIPINSNALERIYFRLIYDDTEIRMKRKCKLNFGYFANLSDFSNYFFKDSKIVYSFKNSIFIDNYSFKKICVREYHSMTNIIHSNQQKLFKVFLFRIVYLLLFLFLKNKRIWLFEDRLNVADDNAEYLFKYAIIQKDDIKKYFIIQKDCDDYQRISEITKNVVEFGSLKHKILYIFSEKIISSHVDHSVLNPFAKEYNLRLLNGLFTREQCFLQHGITKDNMSYWIKKYYVNLFLFLASSEFEYKSLFDEEYNFDDDVVQILGFPRYDTLNNNNIKKQILFMPTWRNQVRKRSLFEKSAHFKRLNRFINNKKLINYLSENNFQLIFKPHFEIMEHIDLFDIPNEVKLSSNDSYQKLFNESSILITDFSSVAFDFAYLKKPVIYYQQDDDYHNLSSYFDYETMGFGEVVKSEDELVDVIIDYINNDCKMKEKYVGRVKNFYKFNDKNNCERVYKWLKENK